MSPIDIIDAQFSSINKVPTRHRRQRLAIVICKVIVRAKEFRKFGFISIM
jgi:hypothetical protein